MGVCCVTLRPSHELEVANWSLRTRGNLEVKESTPFSQRQEHSPCQEEQGLKA